MNNRLLALRSYSIRGHVIEYKAHCAAIDRIERLHQRSRLTGQPGGLLITGLSGSGKSTVKQEYQARFPSRDTGEAFHVPVLTVDTPAGPTVKNLAESILAALGDELRYRGTTEQKTQRIYHYLRLCKVELILIDEFQHFVQHGGRSQILLVTDWLKNLIDTAGIPVVLIGLPDCESVLNMNVQLARRFSARHYLKPFVFDTEEDQQEFRALLQTVQDSLPMPAVSLSDPEMAQRFYVATFGLIDFVCKLADTAVQLAAQYESRRIDSAILAEAFEEEVWRDAPKKLNPFTQRGELRLLIGRGEPFYKWANAIRHDQLDLAKKSGLK